MKADVFTATSTTATSTFAGFIDVNGTGSNATSTFASNLWVKGALKIGTSSLYLDTNGISSTDGTLKLRAGSTATSTFPLLSVGTTTATTTAKLYVDGGLYVTSSNNSAVIGSTFGNARGTGAIDIQTSRTIATQVAQGTNSIAIGSLNTSYDTNSVAIGNSNTNASGGGGYNFAIGYANNTSGGAANTAIGYQNAAYNSGSSALGYQNQATGNVSTAVGNSNIASGAGAVALGAGNNADSYTDVIAIGIGNTSTGDKNVTFGHTNSVTSNSGGSGAFGYFNTISSVASGDDHSFVFGYNNQVTSTSVGGNSAFGNNNVLDASNATEDTIVFGKDVTAAATDAVILGNTNAYQLLLMDGAGFFATGITQNSGTGSLCWDSNTSQILINDFTDNCTSSTRESKHDIARLTLGGISTIQALTPVSFVYNNANGRTHYGFIAEDTAAVGAPFATYNTTDEISGIDDRAVLSITVKALQEMNQVLALGGAPTSTPSIFVSSLGNVGIGLEDATYKLQAKGDIGGYGFAVESHRSEVSNIHRVEDEDLVGYTEKLQDIKISTFTFDGDTGTSTRLGILGNDAPSEILTASGDVDVYKLSVFTLGAVKAQQIRLDSIEERLGTIEESLGLGRGGFWSGSLASLEDFGITITSSLAQFKNVLVAGLTIGSSEKPTGITLYDEVTGEPYCVKVANGRLKNLAGECGDDNDEVTPPNDDEPVATSTPPTAATSTPPTTGDNTDPTDDITTEPPVVIDVPDTTPTPDPVSPDNTTTNSNPSPTSGDTGAGSGDSGDAGSSGTTSGSGDAGSSGSGGDSGSPQP